MSASEILRREGFTCVLMCGGKIYTSRERGVKPLLAWLESGCDFGGASAADKVVGKAAAFLYLLLGVRELYAQVISESALAVLTENGMCITYDEKVPAIRNRDGTGFCPMEQAVKGTSSPDEALLLINRKLCELRGN